MVIDRSRQGSVAIHVAISSDNRHIYDAVRAGLTFAHSNGQTEGFINKLKLTKRSMYGRGKFDLLRQRVLHAA